MDLNLLWFVLLGVLLAGYAVLDGFDLGVGILHPLAKGDRQRRIFINAIGPIWDGNEVWLVTFGGAMFAAFPEVYATVFSGFYFVFMLVLLGLIFRAVSIEFRSKMTSPTWRRLWDYCFFSSSLLATVLFGAGVGNAMIGVPLNARGIYTGGFFNLLNPYALMVGVLAVALFVMHGSIFLYLKTAGDLKERIRGWIWRSFFFFLAMYLLVTVVTVVSVPHATEPFKSQPLNWIIVLLNVLAIANIPRAIHLRRPGYAFVSSCATMAAFVLLLGMALYPNLVVSNPLPENSLTIYNAASSQKTLTIMAIIAAIGMPFVLAYSSVIYWVFRGEVKIDEHSY
ncbi:MAG: cytochrome d ubiquinol oxidase subunit II [Phycisphaerae bacterium]|nr:cytochrome d ubiquinol oxidase subunit II [Phycisphaerae bacterium]